MRADYANGKRGASGRKGQAAGASVGMNGAESDTAARVRGERRVRYSAPVRIERRVALA